MVIVYLVNCGGIWYFILFPRSSIFVFVLEVLVFFVAGVFMMLSPETPSIHRDVEKRFEVEDETTPLLRDAPSDDDANDGRNGRRSPSIGYNSSVKARLHERFGSGVFANRCNFIEELKQLILF